MAYDKCIIAHEDKDEANDVINEIQRLKPWAQEKLGQNASDSDVLKEAAKMASDIEKSNAAYAKWNEYENLKKRMKLRADIEQVGPKNFAEKIHSIIRSTNTPLPGSAERMSVEALTTARTRDYIAGITTDLDNANLYNIFRSNKISLDIVKELGQLYKREDGKPGITNNEQAQQIAKIVFAHQERARKYSNSAGANIGDLNTFIAHQVQDGERMAKSARAAWIEKNGYKNILKFNWNDAYDLGYAKWKDDQLAGLDGAKTFAGVDDQEKFLRGTYNALITGKHFSPDTMTDLKASGFRGPANVAKKASASRTLHYKDAESWWENQKKYGNKNLAENILNSLETHARNTELMTRFGTNPKYELEAMFDHLDQKYRDEDPRAIQKLEGQKNSIRNEMGYLTGEAYAPQNRLWANINRGLRAQIQMKSLGFMTFSHLTSFGTSANELRYHGVNLGDSYYRSIEQFVAGKSSEEKQAMLEELGVHAHFRGLDIGSKFLADDGAPGALSAMHNAYFRLNGFNFMLRNKLAGTEGTLARRYGQLIGKSFEELPDANQKALSAYGLNSKEWDLLRNAPDHLKLEGEPLLTAKAAGRISDADAEAHLREKGDVTEKTSDAALASKIDAFRDNLGVKFNTMYSDSAARGVVTPGIRERAQLTGGMKSGTFWGEVVRDFGQFKSWPLAYYHQVIEREIKSDMGGAFKTAGVIHLLAASIAFGYTRMAIRDMLSGREPRSPTDMSTLGAALLQGGGAGLYGDFLFGQYNRFGQDPLTTVLGPAAGDVSDVLKLWNNIKDGKDVGSEALNLTANNLPYVNMFYTRAALNYLVLWRMQEALSPGWASRYEEKIAKENSQNMWLRPSSVVYR